MKHTERELIALKQEVQNMWRLVLSQLEKSKEAFFSRNRELAREVISREKRVNAFELKIDSDCENYIALFSPVAIDLRLVLSIIKISNTLERIGDFSEGIARHIIEDSCDELEPSLYDELRLSNMFDIVTSMLSDSLHALEEESTKPSGKILAKDEEVDEIYHNSIAIISEYLKKNPNHIPCGLKTILLIRKLERIGDHCSNIVEEIVFYIDAKVLNTQIKHKTGKCMDETLPYVIR